MRNTPSVASASHSSCGVASGTRRGTRVRGSAGRRARAAGAGRCRRRRASAMPGSAIVEQRHLVQVRAGEQVHAGGVAGRDRVERRLGAARVPSTTGWNGSEVDAVSRATSGSAARTSSVGRASSASTSPGGHAEVVDRSRVRPSRRALAGATPTTPRRSAGSPRGTGRARRGARAACRRSSRRPTRRRSSRCRGRRRTPAMLSRTHSSAAIWSRMPTLPEPANAPDRTGRRGAGSRTARGGS